MNKITDIGHSNFILSTSIGIFHLDSDYNYKKIYTNNEEVINCTVFKDYFFYLIKSGLHTIPMPELLSIRNDSLYITSSSIPFTQKGDEVFLKYDYESNPPIIGLRSSNIKNNESGFYSYTISTLDKRYESLISENLTLPYLNEGNHTIDLQGYNLDMTKSNVIRLNINIVGPFWRQWWFIFLVLASMAIAAWYYTKLKTKRLEEQIKIKEEIYQLEKSALQAQMNPHFIFNCLNSIQSFIMDNDKENAMDYLGRFAHLIRGNLNASINPTLSLAEEIRILDNYLSLEKLRLNNKFEYVINYSPNLDLNNINIPPMLIQPFVENAVIHGMRSIVKDGQIEIDFNVLDSTLKVEVLDNGLKSKEPLIQEHKSVGMSITKKRLAFINQSSHENMDSTIHYTPSGTLVTLSILL